MTVRSSPPPYDSARISESARAIARKHLVTSGTFEADFQVDRVAIDRKGIPHVRLQRTIQGLPVFGSFVVVHGSKMLTRTGGAISQIALLKGRSLLSKAEVERAALDATFGNSSKSGAQVQSALLWYPSYRYEGDASLSEARWNASDARRAVAGLRLAYVVNARAVQTPSALDETHVIAADTGTILAS